MEDIVSQKYPIRIASITALPNIDFSYYKGVHSKNQWKWEIDLSVCKINFFIEGKAYIIVNGKSYYVEPGDIMIYRPHDIHYGNIPYEQYVEYYELQFDSTAFDFLNGGNELTDLFANHDDVNTVQMHTDVNLNKALKDSFEKLILCMGEEHKHKNVEALTTILRLLLYINDCKEFAVQHLNHDSYPKVLTDAVEFIDCNYFENITTEDISKAVFVSRVYLNKLFQNYLNCSIHKYVLLLRISKACSYLSQGMSVSDTAMEVGFQSSTSFSGAFKNICKISPAKFRNRYYKK